MADETLLVLAGVGVPPYSARGLEQTLVPIDQAISLARTVNGELVDLSSSAFRKYRSTINGNDQQVPAVDGVWPGAQVTVDCIVELAYPTGGVAQRTVVPGSSRTANGFTFYRPRLTMLVTGFDVRLDEWDAVVGWSMDLEEV